MGGREGVRRLPAADLMRQMTGVWISHEGALKLRMLHIMFRI